MNPQFAAVIAKAIAKGYTAKSVLQLLAKQFPQYANVIANATALGYTADVVLKNLVNPGGKNPENSDDYLTLDEKTNKVDEHRRRKAALTTGGLALGLGAGAGLLGTAARAGRAVYPSAILPPLPQQQGLPAPQQRLGLPNRQQFQPNVSPAPNVSPGPNISPAAPIVSPQPNMPAPTAQPLPATQAPVPSPITPPVKASQILGSIGILDRAEMYLRDKKNRLSPHDAAGVLLATLKPAEKQRLEGMVKSGQIPALPQLMEQFSQELAQSPQTSSVKAAASSLESALPVKTSAGKMLSPDARLQQEREGSQISTASEPLGDKSNLAMVPSILDGPSIGKDIEDTPLGTIDPNSNRIIRQKEKNVEKILTGITNEKPNFDKFLEQIKQIPGVGAISSRLKDPERLREKIKQKGSPESIGDYLGGRIIVDDPKAIDEIRERLKPIAFEEDDFLENPRDDGYRAIHYQIPIGNGLSAEVQVLPKDVKEVFKEAHTLYDKWKRKEEGFTPAKKIEMFQDYQKMKNLFDTAWSKFESKKPAAKLTKGSLAGTPDGVGEIKSISGDNALIEVNGKNKQVKLDQLQEPPKDLDEATRHLVNLIPEDLKSTAIQSAVHVNLPGEKNVTLVKFYDGKIAWYLDVPDDIYSSVALGTYEPKGKAKTGIAEYKPGVIDSRGAGFSEQIRMNPLYSKENRDKTWGYAKNEYDALAMIQPTLKQMSKEKYDEKGNLIQPKKRKDKA